jgi:predicted PurR-regulated permease PerM
MPYLGAFVIWIPLAIFLALQGSWDKALVTTAWGTIVIGLSDNLLYPYLVGRRLHYHSLVVFFFLLGGVLVFGPAGIVLGPISLAIAAEVLSRARAAQGAVNGKSEAPISGIS